MTRNKSSFKSENLIVDYISFNLQNLTDRKSIHKIATYLSESFGFNSSINNYSKRKGEILVSESKNKFKVSFSISNLDSKNYWTGTIMSFSGKNAAYFYSVIKRKKIDWINFNTPFSLGRFDLYYFREPKFTDQKYLLENFMEESCKKIHAKSKKRQVSWRQNSKGLILRVGSRQSSNYCHVYQKCNGLEFELEIKKGAIKSVQKFLFSSEIQEFEDKLSMHFYKQYRNSISLNSCYTDWLVDRIRKIFQNQNQSNYLVTSYLKKNNLDSFAKREGFVKLLQFLSFIQHLEALKQNIGNQTYYVATFRLSDLLKFIGIDEKNQYQRSKLLKFLISLQNLEPLIQKFSDDNFRSSILFPYLEIKKNGRSWSVCVAIAQELYIYRYPFNFPYSFLISSNKYDLEVKFQLMESMCTEDLEKKLDIEHFLNQFSLSNENKIQVKKRIIDLFLILENSKMIES